jgi:hypothetical protein
LCLNQNKKNVLQSNNIVKEFVNVEKDSSISDYFVNANCNNNPCGAKTNENNSKLKKGKNVSNKLSFLHYNVEGLGNKIDLFQMYVLEMAPHVVVATEHQKTTSNIHLYGIDGYNMLSNYCRVNHKGGGVAIYVSKAITNVSEVQWCKKFCVDLDFEIAMVKIKVGEFVVFVIGLYRSPSGNFKIYCTNFQTVLTRLMKKVPHKHVNLVILGDLNIDTLAQNKHESEWFKDCIKSFGLVDQLGHIPTRITPTSETSVDHVVTNIQSVIEASVVNGHISDHLGQVLVIDIGVKCEEVSKFMLKRNFSNKNIDLFKKSLSLESWESVYLASSVELKWSVFLTTILWHLDNTCPLIKSNCSKKSNLNPSKVVLDKHTLKLKQNMKDMYDLYSETKNEVFRNQYKEYKKRFRKAIRSLKSFAIQRKIKDSDCVARSSWAYVNTFRNKSKTENNIQLMHDGKIEDNPLEICNMFNKYFVNNFKVNYCIDENVSDIEHACKCDLDVALVDEKDVLSIIDSLKGKKSSGWDQISPYILKQCKEPLLRPLVHLINSVLIDSTFPSVLKLAIIKPVFKKGEKTLVENFRPISLLSTFSKLVEKVLLFNLIDHFEYNQLMQDFQHGFRGGRSTTSAAAEFIHTTLNKINDGSRVAGVYLDLSRAFDRVNHNLLLNKLVRFGIKGKLLRLLKSYLEYRYQSTQILYEKQNFVHRIQSPPAQMLCGVPQGSILGPYLFIIFVNDFSIGPETFITMYADDTSALCWAKDVNDLEVRVQNFISEALGYFQENQLSMNIDKTGLLLFRPRSEMDCIEINIENDHIYSRNINKFLGLYLDSNLSWSNHVDHVCNKISSGLYLMKRLAFGLDAEGLRTVYFGVIYPYISYGLLLWGSTFYTHTKRVFTLQKRAVRLIANVDFKTSCKKLFLKHNLLTIYGLYIYLTILLVKHDNKFSIKNNQIHSYNTRQKDFIHRNNYKRNFTLNSPYVRGAIYFNMLPNDLKRLEGKAFNNKLKALLINKVPYNLDVNFK